VLELLQAQRRRVDLLRFRVDTHKDYLAGWVHADIAERLETFSQAVTLGKSPRLILCMPPRHGKTMLASEAFPVWHLGRNPYHQIIAASYSADLANKISKRARGLARHQVTQATFPELRLDAEKQAVQEWETEQGGGYRAAGVGGGITGMGAHVLVIDDPIKDRQDAESETIRDTVYDWYTSTAYTRLMPGGGVLVILTRWHGDDLVGRLLKAQDQGGDQWETVIYPAIAEENEPHRNEGEALHPERYNIEALRAIKNAIGPYDWSALYQQRPTAREDYPFKSLQYHTRDYRGLRLFCTVDMAYKKKKKSDYTATIIGGTDEDGNWYELWSDESRMDAEERVKFIFRVMREWQPRGLKQIHIEGHVDFLTYTLPQAMRREKFFFGVEELLPHGASKEDRILEAKPYLQFSYFLEGGPLAKRLLEWTPNGGMVDDLPDAFAYQRKLALAAKPQEINEPPPKDPIHRMLWNDMHGLTRKKDDPKPVGL
jgi:hypothetical protein